MFCSKFKCSFDEFVREKVVSLSYSSTILAPPPLFFNMLILSITYWSGAQFSLSPWCDLFWATQLAVVDKGLRQLLYFPSRDMLFLYHNFSLILAPLRWGKEKVEGRKALIVIQFSNLYVTLNDCFLGEADNINSFPFRVISWTLLSDSLWLF